MARVVLVSDTTLSRDYTNLPLLDFLPSAPSQMVPETLYQTLKGSPPPSTEDGRALIAPYSIRKIEASLLASGEYTEDDVVVAHEDRLEEFLDEETELVGVTTMDPLGLGPLTMSYSVFFGSREPAHVKKEFETLMGRLARARRGKKAKLLVGGPGVWELTVMPDEMDRLGIDYAFQGEADDVVVDLFRSVTGAIGGGDGPSHANSWEGETSQLFHNGFQTFDEHFHRQWIDHERFISRYQFSKQFPALEDIPEIVHPTIKGMVEVMRGCGVGCDFCEVTLRPSRYYPLEKIRKEIEVNARAGLSSAWLHSDEIFAYKHGRNFVPNSEALEELFGMVMGIEGVSCTNPTHGRISIPAAYPELIRRLSGIVGAGPSNWIGVQMGIETGSDRLASIHMPNKTLPLKVGPDGSWGEIVWRGTYVMNRYYWRPAFTVQVGQASETPEDNWETVALINIMSNSEVEGGRPLEFSVTPMQNVPLGLIKSREFASLGLDQSQLAVYFAAYRHLAKMATRNWAGTKSMALGSPMARARSIATGALLALGAVAMFRSVRAVCKRGGLDLERAASYGLNRKHPRTPSTEQPRIEMHATRSR